MAVDMVRLYVSADLPIRSVTLPLADRVEIRFGKAFPAVLIVERAALDRLRAALEQGATELGTPQEGRHALAEGAGDGSAEQA